MSEKPSFVDSSEKKNDDLTISIDQSSEKSANYDYEGGKSYYTDYVDEYNPQGLRAPTKEEEHSLRRVLGHLKPAMYSLFIAEFAERASYYSCQGILTNFIQRPLPPGSKWGAPTSSTSSQSAGALNQGLRTANALTLLLQFLAYIIPLYGGYIADTKLGKMKTISWGVFLGFISHVLFIIASIPSVMTNEKAGLAVIILAIITLAMGTGFIKPNLLPLLMDQYPYKQDMVKVLPSGENVIVDRQKSLERMTLIFYWSINIGAFMQLATSYCARRIGYWLAFFVPIVIYMIIPVVFWWLKSRIAPEELTGSILSNAFKILKVTLSGNALARAKAGELWEYARPVNMIARGRNYYNMKKKTPITWNDQWVLDIKQTVNACKIFIFFPIYNLADSGIGSVQTSLAGSMTTKGVPNDLFNNFNPLTIIILIPILDYLIYPMLRKYKIDFKPVYRIFLGFVLAAFSNVAGSVIQYQVYQTSPCGFYATTCDEPSPLSAWKMTSVFILAAASECFANTTAYELAYTRSPPNMKGLVMALFLFTTSISAAISQAVTAALEDPHLIWPQAAIAIACFVVGVLFLITFRNLHVEMEEENETREQYLKNQKLKDDNQLVSVTSVASVVVPK